jgi:hypothetical protein
MKNSIFDKMIESNKFFWSKVNNKDDNNGYLLYEMFYSEPAMIYGISKTALSIARIKGLKPICITGLRGNQERFSFINSMNDTVTGKPFNFISSILKDSLNILKYLILLRDKKSLLNLKIEKYEIGPYIYDAVLKALNIVEINTMTLAIQKIIILELCYFYFFKNLIDKYNIKALVLGDNVYRSGLLFELAKYNNIECITPINLNAFSMRKYQRVEEFYIHDRKAEKKVLDLLDSNKINSYIDEYFSKRFSANIEQHDVLKAFSDSKNIYNKEEIIKLYNLKENLPIVVVMNHIFCDAPHAYPDGLYDDYKEWLVRTVLNLKNNKNINFLVKEHPSAELYNEKGVINEILKKLDCESTLLKDDVHSLTILNEFDVVITCGGTIGQEFLYKGKPVVLGARPPYSGFGFTEEPTTKEDYENLLASGIEKLSVLSDKQKKQVNKVIYHDFVLLDNYSDDLEIGGERFYMGRDFNYREFYGNIIKYNKVPLEKQKIYKLLDKFIKSDNKHLLRYK